MDIRERVIYLVRKSGMTQKEFAKAINAHETTVNGWFLKQNRNPSAKYIIPICKLFNVSQEWLLTGKEDHTPQKPEASLGEKLAKIKFALYGEIEDLSDIEKQDILDYIRFKKAQRN